MIFRSFFNGDSILVGSVYVRIKNKNEKLSSGDTFVFNKIILIGNDGTNNLEI